MFAKKIMIAILPFDLMKYRIKFEFKMYICAKYFVLFFKHDVLWIGYKMSILRRMYFGIGFVI